MKRVLIVISDMGLGGAQRSLLSFLKCLTDLQYTEQYDLDLMVVNPKGGFYDQIPAQIRQLTPSKGLRWMGTPFGKQLLIKHFSIRCFCIQLRWILKNLFKRHPSNLNIQQRLWENWKNAIEDLPGHYDVAVSYIDGFPNYYVMEKVSADKKVLWIHNEYQKLCYDAEYDRPFYEKAHGVITISDKCRQCILQAFPHMESKIHILENISVTKEVLKKSQEGTCPEYEGYTGLKLLSVGRLSAQKGYDLAIQSAGILKKKGIDFKWLIAGDGPEHQSLQQQIESNNLTEQFILLGNRNNPYSYMAQCDILVQSSRFEGKSVVLDEAKILCKPVVVTDYTTARDSVEHGKTGWITEMNPAAIAEGIQLVSGSTGLRDEMIRHLHSMPLGNEAEIQKYKKYML